VAFFFDVYWMRFEWSRLCLSLISSWFITESAIGVIPVDAAIAIGFFSCVKDPGDFLTSILFCDFVRIFDVLGENHQTTT